MTDSMSFKKFVSFFVPLLFDDVILVKPKSELFLQVKSIFVKEMHFEMVINPRIFKTVIIANCIQKSVCIDIISTSLDANRI